MMRVIQGGLIRLRDGQQRGFAICQKCRALFALSMSRGLTLAILSNVASLGWFLTRRPLQIL